MIFRLYSPCKPSSSSSTPLYSFSFFRSILFRLTSSNFTTLFSSFFSGVFWSFGCSGLTSGAGFISGLSGFTSGFGCSGFTSGLGLTSGAGFISGLSGFTSGFGCSGFTSGLGLTSGTGFISGLSGFTSGFGCSESPTDFVGLASGTELSSTWYFTSTLKVFPPIDIVCEALLSTIAVLGNVFWPLAINCFIASNCSFVTSFCIFSPAFILAIWYEATLAPFNITFTSTSVRSFVAVNSTSAPPFFSIMLTLISLLTCTSIFSFAFNTWRFVCGDTSKLAAIITDAAPMLNFLIENTSLLPNIFFIFFLHNCKFILLFFVTSHLLYYINTSGFSTPLSTE